MAIMYEVLGEEPEQIEGKKPRKPLNTEGEISDEEFQNTWDRFRESYDKLKIEGNATKMWEMISRVCEAMLSGNDVRFEAIPFLHIVSKPLIL